MLVLWRWIQHVERQDRDAQGFPRSGCACVPVAPVYQTKEAKQREEKNDGGSDTGDLVTADDGNGQDAEQMQVCHLCLWLGV